MLFFLVQTKGLEPLRLPSLVLETSASTNSAMFALFGAEREIRTLTSFDTGILIQHVYQFHHFCIVFGRDSGSRTHNLLNLNQMPLPIGLYPVLVRTKGFEPLRSFEHWNLNPACLPISSCSHFWCEIRESNP